MDATGAVVAEYLLAQAERERALAAVEQARRAMEAARGEYTAAQTSQAHSEQEMQRAAEQLSAGLAALHVDAQQRLIVDDFLVEYHANVACYNCYLIVRPSEEGVADVEAETLSVRVEFPVVKLLQRVPLPINSEEDEVVVWQTTIDRDVDAEQCSVAKKPDHLYLRLPLKRSAKQPLGGLSSFSRVAPEELETASYASVQCRSCDSQLLQPQDRAVRFDKVLPLPSTNWIEMFDFWGSGIGAFEHIPRDGISAHCRRIFVGEADIMMHREDLSPSAITCASVSNVAARIGQQEDDDKQEEQWQTVFCGKCRAVVGLASTENPDTIRFHKHMIAASSLQTSSLPDIFSRYTIDSILSAKLLELADSDGIFRYRLAPLKDSASFVAPPPVIGPIPPPPPPYQLQLLGWETMVQDQHSADFRRVLKVLFAPASDETEVKHGGDDHHHDHSHLPPMHEVALSPETLRIIVKRLEKSSRLLPPSLQTFTQKRVGYLFA